MLWDIIKKLLEKEIFTEFPKQNGDKYSWIRIKVGISILAEDILPLVSLN